MNSSCKMRIHSIPGRRVAGLDAEQAEQPDSGGEHGCKYLEDAAPTDRGHQSHRQLRTSDRRECKRREEERINLASVGKSKDLRVGGDEHRDGATEAEQSCTDREGERQLSHGGKLNARQARRLWQALH